jgi:alkylation response protein AidB-like acyl-CoA dehydrogenase
MRFGFSEDQLLLQNTLREFLAKECPPAFVRGLWASETGYDKALWQKLAELGLPGLLVPEPHGGLGRDEIDLVLLLEEIGRTALGGPLVATALVGVRMLAELRSSELPARWLSRVAAGDARLAVGHPDLRFVSEASAADLLLLPSGEELHAVAREAATVVRQPANDPSRRIFEVRFAPSAATCVARGEEARRLFAAALDRGALAAAAQAIGVADKLIEMACNYARERTQFGAPIGSFQAVKHMLANCSVQLEYARPVVHRAAHSVARDISTRALDVSHAKLVATEAALLAARTALQTHGAIGYTWEHDLHLWMRRAWTLDLEWGGGPLHRARVQDAVLAPDARIGPGETFAGGS